MIYILSTISVICALALLIAVRIINDLENRLKEEIKHSTALEKVYNKMIKENLENTTILDELIERVIENEKNKQR